MRLKQLDGMKWEELIAFLEVNRHKLAMDGGNSELEVAKTAHEFGCEAGAAVAVAYRHVQENGGAKTAWEAVHIYDEISPDNGGIRRLKTELAWVGSYHKTVWPIEFPLTDVDKRGGLANIMMSVAADRLRQGTTTDQLAVIALRTFLHEGMQRRIMKEKESK
jgi:hypothetical protein